MLPVHDVHAEPMDTVFLEALHTSIKRGDMKMDLVVRVGILERVENLGGLHDFTWCVVLGVGFVGHISVGFADDGVTSMSDCTLES